AASGCRRNLSFVCLQLNSPQWVILELPLRSLYAQGEVLDQRSLRCRCCIEANHRHSSTLQLFEDWFTHRVRLRQHCIRLPLVDHVLQATTLEGIVNTSKAITIDFLS